ncbi:divalent metal cation transporter [Vibrio sp. Of14-4]|uniref:NRAMP family divalent metal transporter n=1 Tax=Vibrio sp. Of14-4 TaxID=2724878 RepID=UPI001EF34BC3|nr:divalent metal cation transporter [Vibrio sp. Of14-4]MCG7491395.1 divalent metal cation transporter [Vibrio sp. Of14-4]
MDTISTSESRSKFSLSRLTRSLGPGIMMATIAIGGSHLVASTKAGAIYGWQLVALILLVNLLKYPFFRASVQYTVGTGESIVEGYAKLGHAYVWLFSGLCVIAGIINTAALLLFSASLLAYFIPLELPITVLCVAVLAACILILLLGHYRALNTVSKAIMLLLSVTTIAAVFVAANNPVDVSPTFIEPSPWSIAAIGFLVITMGWMPTAIEISSMTSIWLKSQQRQSKVTAQSALFDFNVGYIGTALLAIVFLALGALVLHGTNTEFSQSGLGFTHQLVNLYTSTIGEWSRYLIATVAFLCIFGSTITAIDGYARTISESQRLLQDKTEINPKVTIIWTIAISLAALAIIFFWASTLLPMLDFAMTLAFITTPFFALLNYILVSKTDLPKPLALSKPMKWLSIIGLIYLFSFLAVFFWWKWLL